MQNNPKHYAHLLHQVIDDCLTIFGSMGFSVASGPEIEDEWHNFDALRVAGDHPARDMQDTFWLRDNPTRVLRTHTSGVQIRHIETHQPPIRIVAPGKVFRNEATDATHEAQFYQIEGLAIDTDVSLSHLKGVLTKFFKTYLGDDIELRLRPGYFPFVEPGVEIDLKFRGKWLEVLGAGMVHPEVLQNAGINAKQFQGFAFGMGIDRLAMMKYNVTDIRLFYQGDIRLHESLV
ncbi:MAG: phenylalanine--tRNA ligase subunit alpha [Bacteroidota bacterium]